MLLYCSVGSGPKACPEVLLKVKFNTVVPVGGEEVATGWMKEMS